MFFLGQVTQTIVNNNANATPASSKMTHIGDSGLEQAGQNEGADILLTFAKREFNRSIQMTNPLRSLLAATVVATSFLAGCAGPMPRPEPLNCPKPQCPSCPACPQQGPVTTTPAAPAKPLERADWSDLPDWQTDRLAGALPALKQSCSVLARRPLWQTFCAELSSLGTGVSEVRLRQFMVRALRPWRLVNADGTREGLVTGYYEPVIRGSRFRSGANRWPIYGVPDDMLTIDLGAAYPELAKYRLRGRIEGRRIVPYWSRGEIDAHGDAFKAPVLLWAADPIDLFFLQIQGSGRILLPDGSMVRVGYADQNGYPYQSIGRWLVAQGELTLDKASMAGIKEWARANPSRLSELLQSNPSFVFFRELPSGNDGPIGALGVPLTAGRSIAVDSQSIPLGAPVFLASTWPNESRPLRRLMVAQDTGGAIKGVVRADFFWGLGPDNGALSGRMRQSGEMWVLLPVGYAPN